eukprot:CAMPEP_0174250826 /NCGR_PEP_ID=MMETSP0439-20130205/869_1 /TAXON_ID=0 /ORGANISM="Stereomyxa ramosa, Strain Chinc5" /LENGTH=647 /DNA_ID=CAMNT_0015330991 /DNA_START=74 /DNA_END=2017 /DNA_ORIENTATION=+
MTHGFLGVVFLTLLLFVAPVLSLEESVVLRVMTFNILYGGTSLNLTDRTQFCNGGLYSCPQTLYQVAKAIVVAKADVVGVQESDADVTLLAQHLTELTGDHWYDSPRTHVISKYKLVEVNEARGWVFVYVEPIPGKIFALSVVHTPSTPYGPYQVKRGASLEEVLALENDLRVPALEKQRRVLGSLHNRHKVPVVLIGDMNSPSHLDWTPAAVLERGLPYPVLWPLALSLSAIGFRDSFREVYPDPVAVPGMTWTPGGPEGEPPSREVMDRIDLVLVMGSISTLNSWVVGEGPDDERIRQQYPNLTSNIVLNPWPSDHRAVVSELNITLANMTTLAAVSSRVLSPRSNVNITWNVAAEDVPRGGNDTVVNVVIERIYRGEYEYTEDQTENSMNATRVWHQQFASFYGNINVSIAPALGFSPGRYKVRIFLGSADDNNTDETHEQLAYSLFWIYPPKTPTTLTAGPSNGDPVPTFRPSEPIPFYVENAAGMMEDWIGIYPCKQSNSSNSSEWECESGYNYYCFGTTGAIIQGKVLVQPPFWVDGYTPVWPLPEGYYLARYMLDGEGWCLKQRGNDVHFWIEKEKSNTTSSDSLHDLVEISQQYPFIFFVLPFFLVFLVATLIAIVYRTISRNLSNRLNRLNSDPTSFL